MLKYFNLNLTGLPYVDVVLLNVRLSTCVLGPAVIPKGKAELGRSSYETACLNAS